MFVLPGWGDAGGWTDPEQYETIQLADVDGDGADELFARTPGGVAIHVFDKTLGQWRPQVDTGNLPAILSEFADPPPLTTANPNPPTTDWTLPQYYDTIQAADIDGQKGDELLGRSASGLIVFKFSPGSAAGQGSWRQLTTSGPFTDADGWDTGPFDYATIQTGDINGDGDAEVIGRNAQGLYAFNWTGSSWNQLALLSDLGDKGGFNDPRYWPSIQLANVDGDLREEVIARDADGLFAYRFRSGGWTKINSIIPPFSDDPNGGQDCPFTTSAKTCFGTGPAYYGTIQFADVDGDGREELVGRASDGLRVRRYRGDTPDGWGHLGTLSDLSDANGYSAQKYWETIQFADIDGNGRAEALARDANGLNAWSYAPGARAWTKLTPTTALTLADAPWGGDRSYYSTIETGDVDGDKRADVVARGPYGIRTWFYNRRAGDGWERYLPEGYTDFAGAQKAAYDELNQLARAQNVISVATVRQVWSADNAPTADDLTRLQGQLIGASLGNCGSQTSPVPPQYATCALPAGSSGFSQADWTAVLNEILAELYWASQVLDHFSTVQSIRQTLFLEQSQTLPTIAGDLNLAAAANASADYDPSELFGGIVGIAGAIADELPGLEPVGLGLDIAAEVMAMLPSSSSTLTTPFQGTYSDLQTKFANSIAEVDKALDVHSQLVRQDQGLLTLLGQLRTRGTWTLDSAGMASSGRQGFALYVYKTLMPTLYARYVITGCRNVPNWGSYGLKCSGPQPSALGSLGSATDFTVIGPPPTQETSPYTPCDQLDIGDPETCVYATPPDTIAKRIWGQVSPGCSYNGNASTEWTFTCSLGTDPQKSVIASPFANQNWDFPTHTGSPVVDAIPSTSLGGSARPARGTMTLTGTVVASRPLRLGRARVVQSRMLHEPQGTGELVRRRSGARLAPLKLSRRSRRGVVRHLFVSRGRGRPLTRLRLWRSPGRTLSFALRLSRARLGLPAACSGSRPGVDLATRPIPLHTRLRIDDGRRRPLVISLRPQWQCQRNRLGAVHRLVVRQPRALPPRRRSLAVAVSGPRRAKVGGVASYRIAVRNRRPDSAYDVRVWAMLPRGFRLLGGGARRAGRRSVRRLRPLPPGRARTVRIRARITRSAHGRRCPVILAEAIDTRAARARVCTRVLISR
jgi:hypothetical protein